MNENVIRLLNEAINAIDNYNKKLNEQKRIVKTAEDVQKDKSEIKEIKERLLQLIKEANMLGAAGQQCPMCGGSGRV